MTALRLRKWLTADGPAQASLPAGLVLCPFSPKRHARAARALLNESYAGGAGQVAAFEDWWPALDADTEYDSELCFVVEDEAGAISAFAQCWTGGFIKDFAVVPAHRRRGIGKAMIGEIARAFAGRGVTHLDLKVVADNASAIAFYRALGFVEGP